MFSKNRISTSCNWVTLPIYYYLKLTRSDNKLSTRNEFVDLSARFDHLSAKFCDLSAKLAHLSAKSVELSAKKPAVKTNKA